MKKRILLVIPALLLAACTPFTPNTPSSSSNESKTSSVSSSSIESVESHGTSQHSETSEESQTSSNSTTESISTSQSEEESTTSIESQNSESSESSEESVESTSSESTSSEDLNPLKTIDIYAINDFHGAIEDQGNSRIGLINMGSYMKKKGSEENTLLLDQGDTWQGSIYSNTNYGHLINDVMCEARFDARTIGNHDFDWGIDTLKQNTARSYNGYTIPVLAANVYNYNFNTKVEGSVHQSEIGAKTVSYTLENGVKVGIVGVIGSDQITSINTMFTKDICFKEHVSIIKTEATNLRNSGCDVVIASVHASQDQVMDNGLESYVDLVLCGHSHQVEFGEEGDLHYAQFGGYGQQLGHITLTYDTRVHDVTNTDVQTVSTYDVLTDLNGQTDTTIRNMVNASMTDCSTLANEVVASNVNGSFYSTSNLPNMMAKAIYDAAVSEGYSDITLAMVNNARTSLTDKTSWTYADIYQAFPFDNYIYIIEATGADIVNEAKYNYVCLNSTLAAQGSEKTLNRNTKYKVAVIDYLAVHTNSSRYYDYFRSADGEVKGTLSQTYRNVLKSWLNTNGYSSGTSLNYYDFTNNKDMFKKDITLVS